MTVLDHLIESLRRRGVALEGQVRPVAVLWTDPGEEWRPLIELMLERLPELLVLGEYRPDRRSGPAIWIRCVVDRALEETVVPEDLVPIVYLPGVARRGLRAGEECPDEWKPLVELMYRGTLWLQPNGSDWTVTAFLTSPRSLGLDIARDRATLEALARALPEVALTPVEHLRGRRLDAADFDRMLTDDVVRDLLRWIADPDGTRARLGDARWAAFRSRCCEELAFDPEVEPEIVAGERLAKGGGPWAAAWQRFAEAPTAYPGVAEVLRRSRPQSELPFARERWPDLNDQDEEAVRRAVAELPELQHRDACELVLRLEAEHGPRRGWVWARMELAPMAEVLEPLARLAGAVQQALGGTTPDEVASAYLERGWQADAASWEALAVARPADEKLIAAAVRHLLEPWLDASAQTFQQAVERSPLPARGQQPVVEAEEGTCILFADGLRFDVARRLADRLEARGCRVTVGHRWAALPTVTATAKPAVTPVAGEVIGGALGEDLAPTVESTGGTANAEALRAAMGERGYQILSSEALDAPESEDARGWLEAGEIDALGHKLGARLARQLGEELERLAGWIEGLLAAGWKAVRVVTDHGWLLLPGGLPKVNLPKHLTATRWARCAVLAGEADPQVPRAQWHWNGSQWFATPPGVACFNRSEEYAHGGLSIQECLIPDILVEAPRRARTAVSVSSITWRGLRCFVETVPAARHVLADLRLGAASGPSVAAQPKPVSSDGTVSLVLAGDEHEDEPLVLVLLDPETNRVLAQRPTRVGESS